MFFVRCDFVSHHSKPLIHCQKNERWRSRWNVYQSFQNFFWSVFHQLHATDIWLWIYCFTLKMTNILFDHFKRIFLCILLLYLCVYFYCQRALPQNSGLPFNSCMYGFCVICTASPKSTSFKRGVVPWLKIRFSGWEKKRELVINDMASSHSNLHWLVQDKI